MKYVLLNFDYSKFNNTFIKLFPTINSNRLPPIFFKKGFLKILHFKK